MIEAWTPEQEVGGSNLPPPFVSFSKTLYSPKVLVIPRKQRVRPDMTEILLTGMLNLNTNKQIPTILSSTSNDL